MQNWSHSDYRTLHSYNLIWAVCHLFPQRWRTLSVQSRETIGQEDHVICLQLRRRAKIQVLRLEPLIRRFFLWIRCLKTHSTSFTNFRRSGNTLLRIFFVAATALLRNSFVATTPSLWPNSSVSATECLADIIVQELGDAFPSPKNYRFLIIEKRHFNFTILFVV